MSISKHVKSAMSASLGITIHQADGMSFQHYMRLGSNLTNTGSANVLTQWYQASNWYNIDSTMKYVSFKSPWPFMIYVYIFGKQTALFEMSL